MSPPTRPLSGWHPEDVKAAIRKRGETLSSLSLRNGRCESYLRNALYRPLYDGEQIIARFLKVAAKDIWPDRYAAGKSDNRRWASQHRQRSAA